MKNKHLLWIGGGLLAAALATVAAVGLYQPHAAKESAPSAPAAPPTPALPFAGTAPTAKPPTSVPPAEPPKKRPNAFAPDLKKALELYKKGDYGACIQAAKRVSDAAASGSKSPDAADAKPLAAAAAMVQALAQHRQACPDEAIRLFDLVSREKGNELAPLAALLKGYENLLYGETEVAQKVFEHVAREFVPSEASGLAAQLLKFIPVFEVIGAEAIAKWHPIEGNPSKEMRTLLASIPEPGKEVRLNPEAEARFKEALDNARAYDAMIPWPPRPNKPAPDRNKAKNYYLKAVREKPSSENDLQIILPLLKMYVSDAAPRGADPSLVQDALPLAQHVVKVSSVATPEGVSARIAYFDALRICRNHKLLVEELEKAVVEIMALNSVDDKNLTEVQRQRLYDLRKEVFREFTSTCEADAIFYPFTQKILARTAKAYSASPIGHTLLHPRRWPCID